MRPIDGQEIEALLAAGRLERASCSCYAVNAATYRQVLDAAA